VIARLPIRYQPRARATVVAGRTVTGVILRGATVRIRLELPRRLSGPIPRHAVVGAAAVLAGGHQLARIPLLLQERLPAVTPTKVATRFLERPTTLVSLGLLLALVIGVGLVLRERVRGKSAARPDPAS